MGVLALALFTIVVMKSVKQCFFQPLFGPHAGQIIMAAVICPREQNIWSEPNMAVIFCPTWTKI